MNHLTKKIPLILASLLLIGLSSATAQSFNERQGNRQDNQSNPYQRNNQNGSCCGGGYGQNSRMNNGGRNNGRNGYYGLSFSELDGLSETDKNRVRAFVSEIGLDAPQAAPQLMSQAERFAYNNAMRAAYQEKLGKLWSMVASEFKIGPFA
jgi:hypothetical protein